MVVINADMSPDRRLFASNGQARNLYKELARNLATRAHPEGNAMIPLVESSLQNSAVLQMLKVKTLNE